VSPLPTPTPATSAAASQPSDRNRALIELAQSLTTAARQQDIALKALGGVGCWLHTADHDASAAAYARPFHDLDLVVAHKQRRAVAALFEAHGLAPVESFNALQGETRLMYAEPGTDRTVDVFLGHFALCHTVPLGDEAFAWADHPALDLVELSLTKLQIVESNAKDLHDVASLFAYHELGRGPEALDAERFAGRLAADWGLWRTVTGNLDALSAAGTAGTLPARSDVVAARVAELRERVDTAPKGLRWKARARVGDRVPWYDTPDEPESDWAQVR
jgi:hypothetical protein